MLHWQTCLIRKYYTILKRTNTLAYFNDDDGNIRNQPIEWCIVRYCSRVRSCLTYKSQTRPKKTNTSLFLLIVIQETYPMCGPLQNTPLLQLLTLLSNTRLGRKMTNTPAYLRKRKKRFWASDKINKQDDTILDADFSQFLFRRVTTVGTIKLFTAVNIDCINKRLKKLSIGDDISTKSSNIKININNICDLISASSEQFN